MSSKYNDIPRVLACKSVTANYAFSRSINSTSYKNLDDTSTNLNIQFDVPASLQIEVEVGFYIETSSAPLVRLVNSNGDEFDAACLALAVQPLHAVLDQGQEAAGRAGQRELLALETNGG
eukprot:COSAG02_NODE_537_length_20638_cov_49.009738_10_plen_120_part_00